MKFGKFGFSSYLGAHSNKLVNQFSNEYYRTSKVPGTVKSLEQTGIGGTDAMWYWGNLELAYDFDTLHTLSIYASPNGGYRNNTNGQNSTQLDSNGMVLSSFDNDILSKNNFPSFDIGFDFIKKFKDNDDHRLNFTAIRELNENNSSYNSLQTYTDRPNVDLNNTNDSRNTEYTLNLDYEKPLKNKSSFETGSKFIFRHLVSDYRMLSRSNASENYTEIPENTNSLSYIQNVGSVYATYARSIKQIKVKLGGRVEQTWIDAQFNSNLAKFTDDYLNFIPTVSLSTKVKKIHTVRLNYSKRIQRPWMYYLNPYVDNSNPQNISFGNPNLVPEKTHSLSLSWNAFVKKNSIDLTLSNSFTDNVITSYTTVESDGIAYTSYYNIARSNSTGINLSFWGSAFDRLKIWLSVSSSFVHITHKLDASQNRSGFSQRGHGSFTWTFDKGFTSSVSGWFWQGAPTIQSIRPLNYNYDFAIRKSMFDKKLHLGFVVTNFLQKTQTLKTTSEDPTFSAVSYNRNLVFRYFSVSASFNFGKLKENVSRKRGISNDDKKTEGSGGK